MTRASIIDECLAALSRADPLDPTNHAGRATGSIYPAQRFDREAVKAMLVEALEYSAFSANVGATLSRNGNVITLSDRDPSTLYSTDFEADELTDRVLAWFTGRGAG